MCCTRLAGNTGRKKSPKNRHLGTIAQLCWPASSQLRHVSTIGKKLLNVKISSTSSYNTANFGPLTAEIGSGVWGTPANFNGFRVLASLLQRRRSQEANQTLHDVLPSRGLVHYKLYIFRGIAHSRNFARSKIQFASKFCVLLYWQRHCTTLQQRASAKHCGVEKRAPPIFGRAAINLGIGPRSSEDIFLEVYELERFQTCEVALKAIQGHWYQCMRYYTHDFLLVCHCLYLVSLLFPLTNPRDALHHGELAGAFNIRHLHLAPPFEFCRDFQLQKPRVTALSCGVVCVILRLAVSVEHRLATDRQTDGQTHTHRRVDDTILIPALASVAW